MYSPPNPLSPPVGGKRGLNILNHSQFPLFAGPSVKKLPLGNFSEGARLRGAERGNTRG